MSERIVIAHRYATLDERTGACQPAATKGTEVVDEVIGDSSESRSNSPLHTCVVDSKQLMDLEPVMRAQRDTPSACRTIR